MKITFTEEEVAQMAFRSQLMLDAMMLLNRELMARLAAHEQPGLEKMIRDDYLQLLSDATLQRLRSHPKYDASLDDWLRDQLRSIGGIDPPLQD
ncbi:MAG: hypothetical protein Q8L89_04240 [Gammaproteobacteria bacterium]|nr:hypothetical protein [Gammaproteobacteria bacterium]